MGLQRIAGEDGGRFVEGLVVGGLAAAQIVIIHGRQIVMDQAVGVHHLDGAGDAQRRGARDAELPGAFEHEKAAHPLAAADGRVAHGIEQPGLVAFHKGEKLIEG